MDYESPYRLSYYLLNLWNKLQAQLFTVSSDNYAVLCKVVLPSLRGAGWAELAIV